MTKSDYEKLLKRIEKNISKTEQTEQRFKLPPADVSWEGKKTYLRNFIEFCCGTAQKMKLAPAIAIKIPTVSPIPFFDAIFIKMIYYL